MIRSFALCSLLLPTLGCYLGLCSSHLLNGRMVHQHQIACSCTQILVYQRMLGNFGHMHDVINKDAYILVICVTVLDPDIIVSLLWCVA